MKIGGRAGQTHPKYLNKQKKKIKRKDKREIRKLWNSYSVGRGCIPITVNFLIFTSISYTPPPLPKKGNSMIIHSICKYKKNVCCDQKGGGVGLGAGPLMLRAWIPMIFLVHQYCFMVDRDNSIFIKNNNDTTRDLGRNHLL